jgi:hypothetical protein
MTRPSTVHRLPRWILPLLLLGVTFDLLAGPAPALRNLALLAIGLGLLAALVAWVRPRMLEVTTVFVFTAIAYAFTSAPFLARQSDAPHYVYLADAFAHGRFTLTDEPPCPEECDWTYYHGRWMVAFPPMPAILMLPFVAWAGTDFNDVVFTLLLGPSTSPWPTTSSQASATASRLASRPAPVPGSR